MNDEIDQRAADAPADDGELGQPVDDINNSDTDAAEADGADTGEGTGREAARYRRRLRDAERQHAAALEEITGERDQLRDQLTGFHAGEAERLATSVLTDGADLWRDGAAVADMLGDDGQIDPERVAEAARTVAASHAHWRRPTGGNIAEMTSGTGWRSNDRGTSWQQVLQNRDD